MKKWSKVILVMLCVCLTLGMTACGMGNNADDGGANNAATEQNHTNDATDHTGNGGVVDDVGDAVGEGIDDVGNAVDDGMNAVGDGVEDITDDVTGNHSAQNNTTTQTEKNNN